MITLTKLLDEVATTDAVMSAISDETWLVEKVATVRKERGLSEVEAIDVVLSELEEELSTYAPVTKVTGDIQ